MLFTLIETKVLNSILYSLKVPDFYIKASFYLRQNFEEWWRMRWLFKFLHQQRDCGDLRVSGAPRHMYTGVIGSLIKNGMRSPCKNQIFLMALNNVVALLFGGLSSNLLRTIVSIRIVQMCPYTVVTLAYIKSEQHM